MTRLRAGWPFAAALSLAAAGAAPAATLAVEGASGRIVTLEVPDGGGWCLRWNHSVTGGAVADCFVNLDGRMILDRSYLHDFAAGLGEVPGRGVLQPDEDEGYWIVDIHEPIEGNALILRVGSDVVDHRIEAQGRSYDLSERAAGERVTLRLIP